METTEIKKIQELQELASTLFATLKPAKHGKDEYIASFTVYGYKHLLFVISDLMKLCVNALEDEFDPPAVFSKINITQILEIAIELLPIDEAEFLDKSRELFLKENKDDTAENKNS